MVAQRERDLDIVLRIRSGDSIGEVADAYNLSRQRIHQIVRRASGGDGIVAVRGVRASTKTPIFEQNRDSIAEWCASGETMAVMAQRLGVATPTLRRWLDREGIERLPRGWRGKARAEQLQELIDSGLSITDAAKQVGISRGSASNYVGRGLVQSPYHRYGQKHFFDVADVIRRHEQGETLVSIAKELDMRYPSLLARIRNHRKRMGERNA